MELVFPFVTLFFAYFLMVRINSDRVRRLPFMRIPAAHRGLYTKDQSVPENSLAAFRLAVEHGYAIELDVQCSKDLEVFVFHDSTLQRMCNRPEHLEELDAETLHPLKLGSTEEKIPTFRETLALIDGKVPLWIEIKTTSRRQETVDQLMKLLKEYKGTYSICSFDPLILVELRRRYPSVIRGIIVESFTPAKSRPGYVRFILYFSLLNFASKPDYQSFDVGQRHNPTYMFNRLLGALSVFWVVRSCDQEKNVRPSCDNIIFESYLPDLDKPS